MTPRTQSETGAVYAAYIVFSADSAQAELFLPGNEKTEGLDRRDLPGGGHAWNVEDDDTKNVRQADGHWVIEQRGNTIYVQDPYPINVVFDGTDGKTKKRYRIDVVFEPDLARVTLDGTVFYLAQYVTDDGIGHMVGMVGCGDEGREARLSMRDGIHLSLTIGKYRHAPYLTKS